MLAAVPGVGGAAVEIFNAVIGPPVEKRRDEWREVVGETLRKLKDERGVNLDELRENPVFVDCVLQATQLALRNSQADKRAALRNTIANAALPGAPSGALQQMFLNYVDSFTEWHLRLLQLFHNPAEWAARNHHSFPDYHAAGLSSLLQSAYPELGKNRDLYDQVWRDLYLRGLVNTEGLHTTMTGGGLFQQRTTEMGQAFLRFIQEPF